MASPSPRPRGYIELPPRARLAEFAGGEFDAEMTFEASEVEYAKPGSVGEATRTAQPRYLCRRR